MDDPVFVYTIGDLVGLSALGILVVAIGLYFGVQGLKKLFKK